LWPIILVFGIYKRNYILFSISFLGVILIFLTNGAVKSIFLGAFFTILFYTGKSYQDKALLFVIIMLTIALSSLIEYHVAGTYIFSDLAIRRLLFVPPYLESVYYNHFQDAHIYYANSFLDFLDQYKLEKPPSVYIGEEVLGQRGLNANVGVMPDGYMNLGIPGVFIHAIFISFILKFISHLKINHRYFGIFFIYIYIFNTSFLSTMLLTHGFLLFIIFALTFLSKTNKKLFGEK
jgi:hypothetical protein